MPAVSKDQQRAAAIALKAKREGDTDKLRSGAAKNMAQSMSVDELEKYASTKHKGLPEKTKKESMENKSDEREECILCGGDIDPHDERCVECGASNPPNPIRVRPTQKVDMVKDMLDIFESEQWAGSSLSKVFNEEMLGATAEDDVEDQITTQKSKEERLEDRDIDSGKETQDTWPTVGGGKQPALASHPRGPMSGNTMGTRVAEGIDLERWSKLAGLKD